MTQPSKTDIQKRQGKIVSIGEIRYYEGEYQV